MKKEDLKLFIKIPDIKTDRLILRKITQDDLYDVYEYGKDPLVSKHLLWKPHPDITYTKHYLNYITSLYRKGKFYDWGIEYNNKMIGTCGFTVFDFDNNSAQIGYVLNSAYWGQGIAAECVRVLLKIGFDILKLERIEARYLIENIASEKVAKKCGMSKEGVLKNAIFCKGEYRTLGVSAITKDEYSK